MAEQGKASIKRGKPSYFMSILGVTLVLFLLGTIGWLVMLANKLGNHFKESVEVNVYLREELHPKDSMALMNYIASKPYVKEYYYVTKEMAKKQFAGDNDDPDWDKILQENPLPPSVNFMLKKEYVNSDSLKIIKADLEKQTYVDEVKYQQALVDKLNSNIRKISIGLLIITLILSIVVIVLIDNTIRLAMFSNRFLIKTMQMVGATRWFIAKPMNIRAIINGAISGAIAALLVLLLIWLAKKFIPYVSVIDTNRGMILLFLGVILLGVCITVISTHRSVIKYLKMKLDDLY